MDQPLTTVSAAADRTASTETDQNSPLGRATATLRGVGAARSTVPGATALGLLGLFASLLLRVAVPHDTLLSAHPELEDSAAIVDRLEALGASFRLQGDGRAILVRADQALRLRLTLAEEELPRGGTAGGEIFDQQSGLGPPEFLANANPRRALEGDLARTILSLADVRSAQVHLVLPRRELFRRRRIEPSASVTLHLYGERRSDRRQVQAVRHLVAGAVTVTEETFNPERQVVRGTQTVEEESRLAGLGREAIGLVDAWRPGPTLSRGRPIGKPPARMAPCHER